MSEFYQGFSIARIQANREINDLASNLADWKRWGRRQAHQLDRTREALRTAYADRQAVINAYERHIDELTAQFEGYLLECGEKSRTHYEREIERINDSYQGNQRRLIDALKERDQRIAMLESTAAVALNMPAKMATLQDENARLHRRLAELEAETARQASTLATATRLTSAMRDELASKSADLEHAAYVHSLLEDFAGRPLAEFIAELHRSTARPPAGQCDLGQHDGPGGKL